MAFFCLDFRDENGIRRHLQGKSSMKSVFFLVGPFVFSERNGHFEGFESDFVSKKKAKNLFHLAHFSSFLLPPKFGETRH